MSRMTADRRREATIAAALAVARRKGLASTTVRDVAREMGVSSGLIHHYFQTMDEVLAAAFESVAVADLKRVEDAVAGAKDSEGALLAFFNEYAPADADWAFQLWLDAWAEAARRPTLRGASQRLNLAWHSLLERTVREGVEDGGFGCQDPAATAWRILSVLDGLALQVVAHKSVIARGDMIAWAILAAEHELGVEPGTLGIRRLRSTSLTERLQRTPQPPPQAATGV